MNITPEIIVDTVIVFGIHGGRAGHRDVMTLDLTAIVINARAQVTRKKSISVPCLSVLCPAELPVKSKKIAMPDSQFTCRMLLICIISLLPF